MTDISIAAAHVATNELRIGSVISRSGALLSRHLLKFFIVAVIAYSPLLLIASMQTTEPIEPSEALSQALWASLGVVLRVVLSQFCDAIILHAAFQDMRRRPVRLVESLNVGLSRFFPLVVIAFVQSFLIVLVMILVTILFTLYTILPLGGIAVVQMGLAILVVTIPGLILFTMWFVGLPACLVERLGPWTSLRRSRELTKGYRWKVIALALLLPVVDAGRSKVIVPVLTDLAGPIAGLTGQLIWTGVTVAFTGIVFAVTYYDLRVIKEGVDIEQITAVFD
jgi:magnesium-transporting ATPase (P-type)